MRTGVVNLPLHYGKAPRWLFEKMVPLSREISRAIIYEYGSEIFLEKLSDPFWFQSFGCVLGFDWHSSGLTTTTLGALKESLRGQENELGIYVCGGKGKTSRKTPQEIEGYCEKGVYPKPTILTSSSRLSAKVDNSALQDGFSLYHHNFIFTPSGSWVVVQQGMNDYFARRYHWLRQSKKEKVNPVRNKFSQAVSVAHSVKNRISNGVKSKKENNFSFVCEPHSGIASQKMGVKTLNLVARESNESRTAITELSKEKPEKNLNYIKKISELTLPEHHEVKINPESIKKILLSTYEKQPVDFQSLLGMEGVGAKTLRALSLISELIFGVKSSTKDPARFSFAHGGKDGHPYPVDRENYQKSIDILRKAVEKAKIGEYDKIRALKRLSIVNIK